jgi:hypothetical protein
VTPNLQRCIQQARDYPNTATVDILAAAIERELAEEREACAKIAEMHGTTPQCGPGCEHVDEIAAAIRARSNSNHCRETEEQTCPSRPPS